MLDNNADKDTDTTDFDKDENIYRRNIPQILLETMSKSTGFVTLLLTYSVLIVGLIIDYNTLINTPSTSEAFVSNQTETSYYCYFFHFCYVPDLSMNI